MGLKLTPLFLNLKRFAMHEDSSMFSDFLITDINKNVDFCDDILTAIKQGSMQTNRFCGNVYELELTADKAILHNLHDDKINPELIHLNQLQMMLTTWRKKLIIK